MTPACRETRTELLEAALNERALEHRVSAHLADCPDCHAHWIAIRGHARALSALFRHPAPLDLEGRVVAATQAGYRQQRAADRLAQLAPRPAPDVLDSKVVPVDGFVFHKMLRRRAPSVLERLVAEELADPKKALARRYSARLARESAPSDLHARVEGVFNRTRMQSRGSAAKRFTLAAAVLALVVSAWFARQAMRADDPRRIVFEVEHVDSVEQLDPIVGELLFGLTGGASAVAGKEQL